MSKVYNFDRVKLKGKKASDFGHNDLIKTGKYLITIQYKKGGAKYDIPSLLSFVEDTTTAQLLDCTPGMRGGIPYYIDKFLHR